MMVGGVDTQLGLFFFLDSSHLCFSETKIHINSGSSPRVLCLQTNKLKSLSTRWLIIPTIGEKGGKEKSFEKENKISGSPLYEFTLAFNAFLWLI